MIDGLSVLEPDGVAVTYRGERLDIRPLTVGQVPRLVRTARPVVDALLALEDLPDASSAGFLDVVIDLIANHGEQIQAALAIAVDRDQAFIAGGNLAEFTALASSVVEINRDFFVPRLALLQAGLARAKRGDGLTPSSSSSSTATG